MEKNKSKSEVREGDKNKLREFNSKGQAHKLPSEKPHNESPFLVPDEGSLGFLVTFFFLLEG